MPEIQHQKSDGLQMGIKSARKLGNYKWFRNNPGSVFRNLWVTGNQSVNFHPAQRIVYLSGHHIEDCFSNKWTQAQWLIAISVYFSLALHVHCGSGVTQVHTTFTLGPKMMEFPTQYFLLWKREEHSEGFHC